MNYSSGNFLSALDFSLRMLYNRCNFQKGRKAERQNRHETRKKNTDPRVEPYRHDALCRIRHNRRVGAEPRRPRAAAALHGVDTGCRDAHKKGAFHLRRSARRGLSHKGDMPRDTARSRAHRRVAVRRRADAQGLRQARTALDALLPEQTDRRTHEPRSERHKTV